MFKYYLSIAADVALAACWVSAAVCIFIDRLDLAAVGLLVIIAASVDRLQRRRDKGQQ